MRTMRTRIKVCGITDPEEALAIAALGVDALGFIFAPASPRLVEVELVQAIVATLPPLVDAVGVFLDHDPALVNEIAKACRLSLIQLHGHESPDYCRAMVRPVLKAFRVREGALPELSPYRGLVKGVLLDTYRSGQAGGTGATFDWGLVGRLTPPGPVLLAGGLTPNNVGQAIRQARPFAVDVNSGVEVAPGRKDLEQVRRLVAEVRQADQAIYPLN